MKQSTRISITTALLLSLIFSVSPLPSEQEAQAAACPSPIQDGELHRLQGATRIETATAISQDMYPGGTADSIVLARADAYPDALVGAPFARIVNGPLLLTQSSSLSSVAFAEIVRALKPGGTVYLLGGTSALSDAITLSLSQFGIAYERIGGADRYATAVSVAERFPAPGPIQVGITTGEVFADALSLGAPAARDQFPIVLTRANQLPASTAGYLSSAASEIQGTYIAGGTSAVSASVEADILSRLRAGAGITRYGGADRYATSVAVVEGFFGSIICTVSLANGENFPDGLAGAVHSGMYSAGLMLTRPDAVPSSVQAFLESNEAQITDGYVYGGPVAVSDLTLNSAELMFDPASFLFWGDSGESNPHWDSLAGIISAQVSVGDIDGALMLGDNIYETGASSAADPLFNGLYETPLSSALGSLSIYTVLGNHDVITNNGQAELDYASTHDYWYMPARNYATTVDGVRLLALETNQAQVTTDQATFMATELAADKTSVHRIAIGHHPVFSSGDHGNTSWLQGAFKQTLEQKGVDFYFAGHDHNFEAINPQNGVNYIVSGGASRLRPITSGAQTLFAASTYHIGRIDVFYSYADVTIIDETGATVWTHRYQLQ